MRLSTVLKNCLLTEIPVILALALWIFIRADSLIELSKDLPNGFMTPRNLTDVMVSGLAIWIPASLILGLLAGLIFYAARTKWHWSNIAFASLIISLGLLVSVMAFVTGLAFKVEATGEVMIIALGYGLFMPWLMGRKTG
jgi:hypothetical protein